jgi:hypothetical protein
MWINGVPQELNSATNYREGGQVMKAADHYGAVPICSLARCTEVPAPKCRGCPAPQCDWAQSSSTNPIHQTSRACAVSPPVGAFAQIPPRSTATKYWNGAAPPEILGPAAKCLQNQVLPRSSNSPPACCFLACIPSSSPIHPASATSPRNPCTQVKRTQNRRKREARTIISR